MPDLCERLLPKLHLTRLPGLDLSSWAVQPAYDGLSLLNVPASLARWLGAPPLPHPGLDLPELEALAEGARQVVLCLIDAVSLSRFRRWLDGPAAFLRPHVQAGLLAPLTSVAPSTTTSALTTLWTGRSPAEHGIVGYELLLREHGLVANMITLGPAAFEAQRGLLERAGIAPPSLIPVPTLGTVLSRAGVETHAFIGNAIRGSGLSRMHYAGVEVHGFGSPADLWRSVGALLERPPRQRRLIWAYYSGVDALSHLYGPDSEPAAVEFAYFARALAEIILERNAAAMRRDVLLILLSDHGQVPTRLDPHYDLRNHPALTRRLHLLPTGEGRHAYLYAQPGGLADVCDYVEATWPGRFSLLPSAEALQAGLYGPGAPAEVTLERLGDRIALARDSAYLWWEAREDALLGRHGSLTPDEMLVPLLAIRLG